jgi:hypothetical protein
MQRPTASSAHDVRFRSPGFGERLVGRHGDERVQDRIQPFDARKTRVGEFHGRDFASAQQFGRIRQRHRSHIVRCLIRSAPLCGHREHARGVRANCGLQEVASSGLNHGAIVI